MVDTIEILSKRLLIIFTLNAITIPNKILCPDFWSLIGPKIKDAANRINTKAIMGCNSFLQNSNAIKFDNNILYRDSQQIKVLSLDSYELKAFNISSTYLKINNNFKTHFHNNNFHFVVNRNNEDRVLIKRTKKELFGITNTQKFLINKNYLTHENISLIGIFIIILFILLLFRRYLNSIFLYPEKIKYRNKIVFISDDEYLVLKGFIENQNTLENNILQALLNKDQYHNSHNIRRKNNLVNNLNSKLKILFNDNNINFIEIYKSEFDKRYKKYLLYSKDLKIVIK